MMTATRPCSASQALWKSGTEQRVYRNDIKRRLLTGQHSSGTPDWSGDEAEFERLMWLLSSPFRLLSVSACGVQEGSRKGVCMEYGEDVKSDSDGLLHIGKEAATELTSSFIISCPA